MALSDVFQIVISYEWQAPLNGGSNSLCQNRFFYRQDSGSGNAAGALNVAFFTNVYPAIRALAHEEITFLTLNSVNWMDGTDYLEGVFSSPTNKGLREITEPEVQVTPVNNISFKSNRAGPKTRNARKRFPFLLESDVRGKSFADPIPFQTEALALEAAMAVPISGGGVTFAPVSFRPNPGGFGAGGSVAYVISDWAMDFFIASQDTRR